MIHNEFLVLTCVLTFISLDESKAIDKENSSYQSIEWYTSLLNFNLGIVNGEEADDDEWPFACSIQQSGHQHYCGGSVWNRYPTSSVVSL